MFERIKHMLIKEFIQVLRDPRMKILVFMVPVIQLLLFGYVATTDVHNIATAVYDLDNTVASRELVARFVRSGYFKVVEHIDNDKRERELIDRGTVSAVLQVNKGFEEDLHAGRTAAVQLIVDGTDSNTANIVINYGAKITGEYSANILAKRVSRLKGAARRTFQVELETRAWFNENLESRNFYIPGVMALLLMVATAVLTSLAIVREKEIGTMEQILVTPMTPAEFILGKTVPFALIGFVDVLIVTGVGVFWFDIPVRGSFALILLCAGLYLMTTLGVGLLISTICSTQQQAMMSTFFFIFPAVLLSGFMFPIANMPRIIQYLTYLNPLRYFLVIVRGVFLKGIGVGVLWPQMLALAIIGCFALWLAANRFRKTLA